MASSKINLFGDMSPMDSLAHANSVGDETKNEPTKKVDHRYSTGEKRSYRTTICMPPSLRESAQKFCEENHLKFNDLVCRSIAGVLRANNMM